MSSKLDFEDEITAGACVDRRPKEVPHEPTSLVIELTILVLAVFLGFEVVSKVPTLLHTPLMSGTNAIHGIVIVGAIIVARLPDDGWVARRSGSSRSRSAPANVVGGFVVTDRMLADVQAARARQERGDRG